MTLQLVLPLELFPTRARKMPLDWTAVYAQPILRLCKVGELPRDRVVFLHVVALGEFVFTGTRNDVVTFGACKIGLEEVYVRKS